MNENHHNQEATLWQQLSDKIAGIFLYLLAAYLILLFIDWFYSLARYINFTGFTLTVLLLGLISVSNQQSRIKLSVGNARQKIYLAWSWFTRHPYRFLIGTAFVSLGLYLEADFWEVTIAILGAVSILFLKKAQISGSLAILALVLTAGLTIFNQEIWAERVAVYAFYFLVIAVLTSVAELAFKE